MTLETYLRNQGNSKEAMGKLKDFLVGKFNLSPTDYQNITSYLAERSEEIRGKETFGIVYAITRLCNLNCSHCGANAIMTRKPANQIGFETTTEEVRLILKKIEEYASTGKYKRVFLMFGGGEPTLRMDFEEVLRFATSLLGTKNVGFNTNGTTMSIDDLLRLQKYASSIEISIDGFEEYHNQWRNPRNLSSVRNPFKKSVSLISEAMHYDDLQRKLEVSSVITKDNLNQIPDFMRFLKGIGVSNYSIHRAMPVGRMGIHLKKIPDMHDYIRLLLMMAEMRKDASMHDLHLHHSLESIYSALFIGKDIHQADLLMSSGRHSIGIDPSGSVYFDPWGMVEPFNQLVAGNLLDKGTKLIDIIESEGGIIKIVDDITRKKTRCKQCRVECSGGMRFNALGYYIYRLLGQIAMEIHETHLLAGLSQIDPACPLYED